MNRAAKLRLLERWHAASAEASAAWDAARPAFGSDPTSSPLWEAQWRTQDAATDATAAATGYDGDTLSWWLHECRAGAKPMSAGPKAGRKRLIRTVKDLQWLCELAAPKKPFRSRRPTPAPVQQCNPVNRQGYIATQCGVNLGWQGDSVTDGSKWRFCPYCGRPTAKGVAP